MNNIHILIFIGLAFIITSCEAKKQSKPEDNITKQELNGNLPVEQTLISENALPDGYEQVIFDKWELFKQDKYKYSVAITHGDYHLILINQATWKYLPHEVKKVAFAQITLEKIFKEKGGKSLGLIDQQK